jgi:hypothetical protein
MSNRLGKRKRKERENPVVPEVSLKPFQKGWYKKQRKNDQDMFESITIFFIVLIITNIWVLFDYHFADIHKALAFACLMVGLLSIQRRGDLKLIFTNTEKVYKRFQEANLAEISDAIFLHTIVLSMITFLFIIDLEILSNAGIRIGAAASVAMVSVLGHVIKSFRKNY